MHAMNIQKIMQEAQKAQARMKEAQEKLAGLSVEGVAGGGMVRVSANGEGTVTGVKVDPQVVDPQGVDLLEDLMVAAIGDAQRKARELQQQELGSVLGGAGGLGSLGSLF